MNFDFNSDQNLDSDAHYDQGTFGKPPWMDIVEEEYWACKERVGIADMSSFSKIEVTVSKLLTFHCFPISKLNQNLNMD